MSFYSNSKWGTSVLQVPTVKVLDKNAFRQIEYQKFMNNLRYGKVKKSPRIEVKKVGNMMMLKVSKSIISTQMHIGNSVSMTCHY